MDMNTKHSTFKDLIQSGDTVVTVELMPPASGVPEAFKETVGRMKGRVHAVGISDNRTRIGMSALAAASLAASAGVTPIMHMVTRDRNRIALLSDLMGAQALGIANLLVTTGTHQTLGRFRAAKNVFDIDSIQLLKECSGKGTILENGASPAGLCVGATAAPFADPAALQLVRLGKKVSVGASFVVTQSVFDTDRFADWWRSVTAKGLQEKTAVIAGIQALLTPDEVAAATAKRPDPRIPETTLKRLSGASNLRGEGIAVAVETIKKLRSVKGLRGFDIRCDGDPDAALEIIDKSGLGSV